MRRTEDFVMTLGKALVLFCLGMTVLHAIAQTKPYPDSKLLYQKQGVLVSGGNMSGNITSSGLDALSWSNIDIQAVFTGSPVGTLKLQTSDDVVPNCSLATNWSDYTGSSSAVSGAGNFTWHISGTGTRCMQVVYTFTSGSGSLNVTFTRKGTGN